MKNGFFILMNTLIGLLCFMPSACGIKIPQQSEKEKAWVGAVKDTLMVGSKIFRVSFITKACYDSLEFRDKCRSRHVDVDSTPEVRKQNDTLIITSNDGKKHVFAGSQGSYETSGEGNAYSLYGQMECINSWLLSYSGFEDLHFLLINREDGSIEEFPPFCTEPYFSPDQNYFICGSEAGNIAGVNAIYFYEILNGIPTKTGERFLETWGPQEFKWLNNNTVLVKASTGIKNEFIRLEMQN